MLALLLALALGGLTAAGIARPVVSLAEAADRLAEGDFDAPLPRSRSSEARRVTRAFERMRGALAARMGELARSNTELARREERLQALQSEMIQRDRLAAAGRLVAELAHEIRNPVANVRNCLEVIRRGLGDAPQVARFADLAIDELLRLHELAEQMLDLNRPMDPGATRCDPTDVVERVAALLEAGDGAGRWPTDTSGSASREVAVAPDVLKQVLLSLAQNAREAMPRGGRLEIRMSDAPGGVRIEVLDEGSGLTPEVLPRVFDPFFTTKGDVHGVGLGLFIAEGLLRRIGGQLTALNRPAGQGACFRIDLPAPSPSPVGPVAGGRDASADNLRGCAAQDGAET
jgi:signal transduction histidine kinase